MPFKAILGLSLLLTAGNAYAYLDPGSANIFFQTVVALFVTASFTIKANWFKIKGFMSRLRRK